MMRQSICVVLSDGFNYYKYTKFITLALITAFKTIQGQDQQQIMH